MFLRLLRILPVALIFGMVTNSSALPINASGTTINLDLGNIDLKSYDGQGFNSLAKFNGNVSSFLEFNPFDGGVGGTNYDIFFLSSVADYRNQDTFGLLNDQNQFVTSISGNNPLGAKVSYTQKANETLKLGFQSPESLFQARGSENKDGKAHILGLTAMTDAVLTIPKADQQGNSITFNLLAGDILCFIEDMLFDSTYNFAKGSDLDYNDFLTVVRAQTETVPEPATVCLLGLGALTAFRRRRAN